MRAIKFRGWNTKHKKRIYGDLFRSRGEWFITQDGIVFNPLAEPEDWRVEPESGLWQFCVEKGLIKQLGDKRSIGHGDKYYSSWDPNEYGYRLIKSALVPEEELGKFLVDNIAIGGKKE